MTTGIIPVPEREVVRWRQYLLDRSQSKAALELLDMVERLWRQNQDQASVIAGLQQHLTGLAKEARQARLDL